MLTHEVLPLDLSDGFNGACMRACVRVVYFLFAAARVKIAYRAKVDRARGQTSSNSYPHAESALAEVGWKGAGELGEDSNFGKT